MGNRKKKQKGGVAASTVTTTTTMSAGISESKPTVKDISASKVSKHSHNHNVHSHNLPVPVPGTGNRAAGFEEIAHQFVVAGGQRYVDFFRSLFTNWRDYGSLPPLSTDESAMLSQLYRLWLDSRQKDRNMSGGGGGLKGSHGSGRPVDRTILGMGQSQYGTPSRSETWKLAVEDVKRETGKENLMRMCNIIGNREGGMRSIVSHLDILLKAQEPTKTHAKSLLEVLSSPEMQVQDLAAIERRANAHSASHAVALGFIYDSQLDAAVVKGRTLPESTEAQAIISSPCGNDEDECAANNDVAASRSAMVSTSMFAQRCFQLYYQAAESHDSIAAMQLGGKYLRGEGVAKDAKLALKWYTRAAALNNPIAQHKVGYFFDEGLDGACPCNVAEAIKWYTLASDFMPDSVHNLAKIAEDGRGGKVDMPMAVTLYSIAAARGFPLSQVNLGRLFLLGEDGVRRDREAGQRLLTLAAESGDCDAQMVVGMIHATPVFECFDLPRSEYWLRSSVQGGKTEAELLLARVCQQIKHAGLNPLPAEIPHLSKTSAAARKRGDDYLSHNLADAAALEYTRAYELDNSQVSCLVSRMEALFCVGQLEECISEGTQLLVHWGESRGIEGATETSQNTPPAPSYPPVLPPPGLESPEGMAAVEAAYARARGFFVPGKVNIAAFNSLTSEELGQACTVLAESMVELHWAGQTSTTSEVFHTLHNTSTELCTPLIQALLLLLLEEKNKSQKASALVARLTARGSKLCRMMVVAGGIPIIIQVMASAVSALVSERTRLSSDDPVVATTDSTGSGVGSKGPNSGSHADSNTGTSSPSPSPSPSPSSCAYDAEMSEVMPLESICANGAASIANMVRLLEPSVVNLIGAAGGFPLLIQISCCKQVDLACEALQALSNVAVQADESAWRELMDAGIVSSFVDVIAIALEDLGQLAHGVALEGMSEEDRENLWQDIFEVLASGISALSRVMEVCPVEFTQNIANTPLMSRLHKLFRMDVLPNRLRNITAFVLYNMTCARDPGACKLLHDYSTRAAIRDILQDCDLNAASAEMNQSKLALEGEAEGEGIETTAEAKQGGKGSKSKIKSSTSARTNNSKVSTSTTGPAPTVFPLSLELVFSHVSRSLVNWATASVSAAAAAAAAGSTNDQSNTHQDQSQTPASTPAPIPGAGFSKKHLLVPCTAKMPSDLNPFQQEGHSSSNNSHSSCGNCSNNVAAPSSSLPSNQSQQTPTTVTGATVRAGGNNSKKRGVVVPVTIPPLGGSDITTTTTATTAGSSGKKGSNK